ncbi:coiled-coil domain-containing protein 181 isoform X2 [Rhinatrema bivittatum]|uniref:coiled-coil domain-containing protein 181 isoform X2 n=1 Tax=Rhinatrema bivittatum TaxID=194408 RepID=UPI00112955D1|nr:coiled-coil domain-containing protein 181 isoform X2 [Rhinatrema bivittatum]
MTKRGAPRWGKRVTAAAFPVSYKRVDRPGFLHKSRKKGPEGYTRVCYKGPVCNPAPTSREKPGAAGFACLCAASRWHGDGGLAARSGRGRLGVAGRGDRSRGRLSLTIPPSGGWLRRFRIKSILIMDSLSEKEDNVDTDTSGEYEDDFERDLDWLIDEEKENFKEQEDDAEIEACIDKELAEFDDENLSSAKDDSDESLEKSQTKNYAVPIPDMVSDTESDSSENELKLENPQELEEQQDVEDEEVKRYIMEKIVKANKQLEDEDPIYEGRERKLKFKDNLVDLEVPPIEFVDVDKNIINNEENVLGSMSQLQISDEPKQEHKDGKVLVERDGKFELVSLHDIESQGFLPPINVASIENGPQLISPRSSESNVSSTLANKKEDTLGQQSKNSLNLSVEVVMHVPQPPASLKYRPSSVTNMMRNVRKNQPSRRVQSANCSPKSTTYCLSSKQKELQRKMEQRKAQKKKEEEEWKRQQEEQKKKENQMAFRAWLQKKREQLVGEKRIQQAKELEELNNSMAGKKENGKTN